MADSDSSISISRILTETIAVPIIGLAPLIQSRFAEKAKQAMLDSMRGKRSPRQVKDPEAEYQAAMYRADDGSYGFPVIAFKAATVGAARFFGKDVTMVGLRQSMFFNAPFSKTAGQKLVTIVGEPHMREDYVRVSRGGTDLRYRPEFTEWSTTLEITYVVSQLTRESVLSLVEAGGTGVGVGEWRPQRGGDFGMYGIDPTREVEVKS